MRRLLILIVAVITSYGPTVCAQPQQSENFRITKSVLDAGGGASTSANFQLTSAFGQPTPIGLQSSANFVLSAGFLSPIFSVSPLSPIQDLVIKRMAGLSTNMKLDWSAAPNAETYSIYRDTNPLFTPVTPIGTSQTNSYTDVGAVSLPGLRYYYIVTSSSESNPSLSREMGRSPAKKTTEMKQRKH